MLPTIINLMILARMDIPAGSWKNQKSFILKKTIEGIESSKIELLTFNREEMINQYKTVNDDSILLNIKVKNGCFHAINDTTLNGKIISLLNSRMARVSNFARKHHPGSKTAQTCIYIDVDSEDNLGEMLLERD